MKKEIQVWNYAEEILSNLQKGVLLTTKADEKVGVV